MANGKVCTFHWLVLVVPQVFGKWATYAQLKQHLQGMAYAKDVAAYYRHWEIIQEQYDYAGAIIQEFCHWEIFVLPYKSVSIFMLFFFVMKLLMLRNGTRRGNYGLIHGHINISTMGLRQIPRPSPPMPHTWGGCSGMHRCRLIVRLKTSHSPYY
jgi:hypothetical protein